MVLYVTRGILSDSLFHTFNNGTKEKNKTFSVVSLLV